MASTDQFLYAYTRIYRYQAKLECLDFKLKYMTRKDDLLSLEKLKKCNQFCINLLQNNNINKVFALILCIGNFMNQNNSKREASGFSIYNLNESLITIKSNENDNFFLSHYLVQIIKTKVPTFFYLLYRQVENFNWVHRVGVHQVAVRIQLKISPACILYNS